MVDPTMVIVMSASLDALKLRVVRRSERLLVLLAAERYSPARNVASSFADVITTVPVVHFTANPLSVEIVGIVMPSKSLASPSLIFAPELATPTVVFADVAAVVIPVQVPLSKAMLRVASFAGKNPSVLAFRVREIAVLVPPTVNRASTAESAASAVLTLPAQVAAVSPLVTATGIVLGDPVMPDAVTTTLAFPLAVIVPAAVAVSTWAVPALYVSDPLVLLVATTILKSLPETIFTRTQYATSHPVKVIKLLNVPISTDPVMPVEVAEAVAESPAFALAAVKVMSEGSSIRCESQFSDSISALI